ncbi:cation:proton antiporter [Candidatus Thorarchaeota archaeon]|nr:MAG: cation:proton antiporter [Candidatus Thorarchaeota archaeon]
MQALYTPEVLLLLGIALVLAYFGAEIMTKFGIPKILGFMIAGLVLGTLGIFNDDFRTFLFPIVDLALGLIGYNIGLEIRKEVFRGQTRRMGTILILESILTFVIVTVLAGYLLGAWHIALVFGALASATDPASTVMVIWERKCKGDLTDTLMFILALDDVIAILLADGAIAIAILFYSAPGTVTIIGAVGSLVIDVAASSAIGAILGFVMVYFVNREDDRREILEFELGMIILIVGLMSWLQLSAILSCMVFGFVVGNFVSREKDPVSHTLKVIMSPIVMIFFVIVGASIDLGVIANLSVVLLTIAYVGGRTFAKYFGSRVGAQLTKTRELTTKYLGLCLMSQAGVAVGLSLVVEQNFLSLGDAEAVFFGTLILNVIALTTMILQVFGPVAASEGLRKAGEYPDDLCGTDEIHTIESLEDNTEPVDDVSDTS